MHAIRSRPARGSPAAPNPGWGGWGYPKVPRRRGATAIVMRGDDGLRVVARDGRELVVTVPEAGTAAALLADLVRRGDGAVTA